MISSLLSGTSTSEDIESPGRASSDSHNCLSPSASVLDMEVEQSTEWRDREIIPNEHLASGTDEPWSIWSSLNRPRVQKGRCRAMMKMWKLSQTDVCD